MKKIFLAAFTIAVQSSAWLQAQSPSRLSGIYQNLTLGVDSSGGMVTGYYSKVDEPPNLPSSECSFYLSGKWAGDKYALQVWRPGTQKSATTGELTIFSADKGRASALLKVEKLSRDCTALNPKLGKPEGALFDKSKDGPWTEVRIVGNSKAHYSQTPSLSSPERDSAKRGTVLLVTGRQAGWLQVQANQKPKGWIQESDLYPLSPDEAMPERAELQAEPKPPSLPEPKAIPSPKPISDSKADLLRRLKTLDTQAFALALRVLVNPSERNAIASSRLVLESELNAVVESLDKADPTAYRSEASRIYDTYLDLQFARQEQAVVSLRLRQQILKQK